MALTADDLPRLQGLLRVLEPRTRARVWTLAQTMATRLRDVHEPLTPNEAVVLVARLGAMVQELTDLEHDVAQLSKQLGARLPG